MSSQAEPDTIVVHTSASPNERADTLEDIRRWHTRADPNDPSKPWSDIGYHWVIERTGPPRAGRPESIVGAHVGGQNTGKIGVCLVGMRHYTRSQMLYLEGLIHAILSRHPTITDVCGHTDLDRRKACPNFDVRAWWKSRQENHTG